MAPKRILILGGGFTGLTVAMELEKKLGQRPQFDSAAVCRKSIAGCTPGTILAACATHAQLEPFRVARNKVPVGKTTYPRATNQSCALLLAAAGGESPHAAAVWEHAAEAKWKSQIRTRDEP